VLLLVYAQVFYSDFGFLDDFHLLERSRTDGYLWWPPDTSLGRPLHALGVGFAFGPIEQIEGLRYIRALTVFGIIVCAAFAYLWISAKRVPRSAAAALAVAIFVGPTFQIYSGWATTVAFPFALLAASSAGLIASRALDDPRRRTVIFRSSAGAALGLAAVLTYQPAGMAIIVVAIADLLFDLPEPRLALRRLAMPALVFVLASLTSFAVLRFGQLPDQTRGDLSGDFSEKIDWFLLEVMVNSLDFWSVEGSQTTALLLAVFILGGLLAQAKLVPPRRTFALFLVPFGAIFAYLPNLLTHETWAAYRSLVVLSPFVTIVLAVALRGYWRLGQALLSGQRTSLRASMRSASLSILLLLTLIVSVKAQSRIADAVVAPQAADFRAVSTQVVSAAREGPVAIVLPEWSDGSVTDVAYDEFGLHSSSVAWALAPMVTSVLRARGVSPDAIVAIDRCGEIRVDPSVRVLDLRMVTAPGRHEPRVCRATP
jgi:hypothetical protein